MKEIKFRRARELFKPVTKEEEARVLGEFGDLIRTVALGLGAERPKNCFVSSGIALKAAELVRGGHSDPKTFREALNEVRSGLSLESEREVRRVEPKWRKQIRRLSRLARVERTPRVELKELTHQLKNEPKDLIIGIEAEIDGKPTLHALAVLERCQDDNEAVLVWDASHPQGLMKIEIEDLAYLGERALRMSTAPNLIKISYQR